MRAPAAVFALCFTAAAAAAPSLSDPGLSMTDYLGGLSSPTGLRFTGPNEGFVIEKGGAVKFFSGSSVSTAFNLGVNTDSERGLLGIALDPGFASNKLVYLYYSEGNSTSWTANRLNRYTWNGTTLVETPFAAARTFGTAADGFAQNGPNHNGGPLVFGTDGKLYGVTGDLNRNAIEQNQSTTVSANAGGVYRLNSDGTVPADNPFQSHSEPGVRPWYAYGVRNSFGIAVDPAPAAGGRIWFTENGPTNFDEINVLARGMNSGWKQIMGPDSRDPQNAPGDLTNLPGSSYQDPKFSFNSAIGITSLQFLHGAWGGGAYDDALIVGDVNTGKLWLLRLNASRDGFQLSAADGLDDGVFDAGDTLATFGSGFGIVTDLQVNPYDKNLYIVEINGNVSRVALVPEPQSWLLMLAGLAAVACGARARRGAGPS
jgi:glucose/arabinose dehydrogenase